MEIVFVMAIDIYAFTLMSFAMFLNIVFMCGSAEVRSEI